MMALAWFFYFATFIIPLKTYSLYVDIDSDNIASKVYREFQDYVNSLDPISKEHILLSEVAKEKKIIVNENYSKLMISVKESEKFLKNKIAPKMKGKGYDVTIIPLSQDVYFAYLTNFVIIPKSDMAKQILDDINEKYLGFLQEEKLFDYIKFLNSYFSPSDSERVAKTQFYISKNFLINFTISPYTTSKTVRLNTFKVENISKKEYLLGFQNILNKYDTRNIYLNFETKERVINLRVLMRENRVSQKKK
ncbi:MAG: hypothetical protein RMJ36_03725 [Candidatus Calescibacterium sp.]|nr:hypothetical protein [Candidatus Calescibacterium sp.]MDW8132746.1 hypothetical protein [Candidatus Calescibacterium sp.]